MNIASMLGWIGNIGFIFGAIYLAKGNAIKCAVFNILANLCYVLNSIILYNEPLLALSIGLIVINIFAVRAWLKLK